MQTVATSLPKQLYRTLWRWHFYAGVFAIPFVIILSVTGAIYLFKPQLDAVHDAPYRNLSIDGNPATPEQQIVAALAAVPGSNFMAYEIPRATTDAVNILLSDASDKFRVYVHPVSLEVLAAENENRRLLSIVHDIHGKLLMGKPGSILVELAASWTIVLVLTGIYLWWPRNSKGLGGVLYPRLSLKGRLFWRDLHSVVAMWISFCVLFLLLSGLPWALVWGSAFKELRQLTGTAAQQDWTIAGRKQQQATDEHAGHQHTTDSNENARNTPVSINQIVVHAQQLQLAHPVLITPPSAKSPEWSVKSLAQNRPQRADALFDAHTGELKNLKTFAQRHAIDKAIGVGIAAHEGQLFGWFNQLLGLLTALGLLTLSVSGFIMWRKRAPEGALGAPPAMPEAKIGIGFMGIILISALFLPVLGCSLIAIALTEKLLLSRWVAAQRWLGLT